MNKPSLYGIGRSNRDFSKPDSWSKNKFNSSFPASLIAYMDSKGMSCIYIKLDAHGKIVKERISAFDLYQKSPLDPDLFYSFETPYVPFQPISIGNAPRADLVLMDKATDKMVAGYEIKLTTLPDETTHRLTDDKFGCELVVRMPTIHFLACSLAKRHQEDRSSLRAYFGQNGFGNAASYTEAAQINPQVGEIWNRMNQLFLDNLPQQQPAIIQPIWKTNGKTGALADNCFDVFVWSDLAFTKLFMGEAHKAAVDITKVVNRPTRALIHLFFMLNEFFVHGTFNSKDIFQKLSYTIKNDKAFSVSGSKTNKMMSCPELTKPRITKQEIKHIILGGGQKLLSPERRLDALIVTSPELFD